MSEANVNVIVSIEIYYTLYYECRLDLLNTNLINALNKTTLKQFLQLCLTPLQTKIEFSENSFQKSPTRHMMI